MKQIGRLLIYLTSGALIGFSFGEAISVFKIQEGIGLKQFQTEFVPEVIAAIFMIMALLLYFVILSKQNIAILHQETLRTLTMVLEQKDDETNNHCQRVAEYAMLLGAKFGVRGRDMSELGWGAYLHDIGKIAVPDHILLKPGKLNPDEWELMRKHVKAGFEIMQNHRFLGKGMDIILFHHEKWDGTGYPYGIKNEDIPLFAQIFSVVDAFDAMISDRPYRKGMSCQAAREELKNYSGTQFSPKIVTAFNEIPSQELEKIRVKQSIRIEPLSIPLWNFL